MLFILLFILVWVIPLIKEEVENQNYRESCRRKGYDTYWSTDGQRYTSNNRNSNLRDYDYEEEESF